MNTGVEGYETALNNKIAGVKKNYETKLQNINNSVKSKYEAVQIGMTSMADYFTWPWEKYTNSLTNIGDKPADYYKSFQEIVEENGFGFEEHQVTTDDGYVLHVQRILNDKVQSGEKRPVVFLQHGFLSSSEGWIYHVPEKAPAFTLAREGYDVWLGNNRGTMHSRGHTDLNPENDEDAKKYYDYSFPDLGLHDVPA